MTVKIPVKDDENSHTMVLMVTTDGTPENAECLPLVCA